MIIDNYKSFKDTFNRLFKKYHPDNKETGNAELFIKYKNAYDEALKAGVIDSLPEDNINISEIDAFFGKTINYYDIAKIIIPPKFYNKNKNIMFTDKKGKKHCVRINIVPSNLDTKIYYDLDGNMDIVKYINVTFLDAILGCNFSIDIFGENVIINYKPYELFDCPKKVIKNKGFWKKNNLEERVDVTIRFIMKKTILSKEDIQLLEKMREKYATK